MLNMTKLFKIDIRNYLLCYITLITYLQLCYQLSSANPVCDTPNCKKLGNYYKQNMNEQGKPCADFYDYVCHNWGVHNPKPKYTNKWNVDELLKRRAVEDVKIALEKTELTNGTISDAKALYIACMNLPFMEQADSNTVKKIMAAAGYWPMFAPKNAKLPQNVSWWQIESYYTSKTGESSLLDFSLIANTRDHNRITIFISPPDSPYGKLKLHAPLDESHKNRYKAFLMNLIESVTPPDTTNLAKLVDTDLDDILRFRELIRVNSKFSTPPKGSSIMMLKDFQEVYDYYASMHETAEINWSEMVHSLYTNSKNQYLLSVRNTPNVVVTMSYLSNLAEILAATPERVIVNHVHLYFAERHTKLTPQMEANLRNIFTDDANSIGKIKYDPERWYKCVNNNNLGTTLGHVYLHAHFGDQVKAEVKELQEKLVQFLQLRVSESSWLDPQLKNKSTHKLGKLEAQIGYPNWYFTSRQMNRPSVTDINPINPNVFYAHRYNRLGVSASFLQWPIFTPKLPYAVKYGSTGFVIGHEINHAFDRMGYQFGLTTIQTDFWPDYIHDKLNAQANCFKVQYKKYKDDELRRRHITKTPEYSTINEDVADVMGLKIAYMGYRQELHKHNGICPILPGFEKLGCEKLFFIAFANVFCAASTSGVEEKLLLHDVHSLPKIRINGAVGNMKEFQNAFQCKPNDPIIPEKTCDMWK